MRIESSFRPDGVTGKTATLALASLLLLPGTIMAQQDLPRPASTTPPLLGPPRPLVLPTMVERELPNGLRLVMVEHHELPIVDAVLVVRTGSEADGAAKAGLATLTANMLDEGTGSRDAMALADETAYLAVSLTTNATFESSTISLHTTRATLDSAMTLMADVVLRPTFPEKEFTRLKNERLTSLLQEQDRGPALATRAFSALVFGDQHPYGRSVTGTTLSVESITLNDVKQFWSSWYHPNNATLVIVGDLSVAQAEEMAVRAFGKWERAALPPAPVYASNRMAPAPTAIHIVDKPKAAQSSFRIGGPGVARNTPDYYPLMVLNTALGGSFTSRLNNTLREQKGYTYGAGSAFVMRREAGPFLASAEVVSAKTDSALIEFMKELRGIRQPLQTAELERAKRYLQLGYAARFESTGDIASEISNLIPYDIPLASLGDFVDGVERVTADDVERVARQHIDLSRLTIVIAGDRSSIERPLRAAGLAPVDVRDAEGRPIRTR